MPVEQEEMTEIEAGEVKLATEVAEAEALRIERAWIEVTASVAGRAVLWDIMSRLGMMKTPIRPGQPDMTAHAIGRGDAAREIYDKVSDYPVYLKAMHVENAK